MQDLLVYVTPRPCRRHHPAARAAHRAGRGYHHLVTLNLFITITNANFDKAAIVERIHRTLQAKRALLAQVTDPAVLPEAARWDGAEDEFAAKAAQVGVLSTRDEDIRSLRELITYGLKGLSAYSKHANALLQEDGEVDAFLQRALAATLDDSLTVEDLTALALETGKYGVQGMALLDQANTSAYGNPEITRVSIGVGDKPASWFRAMTCATWRCCSSRPRARAWTCTPTPRCCRRIITRRLRNIPTLSATMATPGGSRRRSLKPSAARS